MPSKRKFSEVSADARHPAVPPQLPPSVEEAYRRKCVELKRRNHQVEEANDAARVRISRIKRQVEKLRVERAFLLEQLTKRTSTNVEDSEGSPSPPPTGQDFDFTLANNKEAAAMLSDADANVRKPKEKPMRSKKSHGKANANTDAGSEATGDIPEAADLKDEELPDAAPAPGSATPTPEEPKDDLAQLSANHAPEGRDLEKDGELPGESEDSGIGAFNMFAAWRRQELSKEDNPDIDIRATLLAEWRDTPTSTKQSLAEKFTELGSSSKILEQIREHDWQPPNIPAKFITKDASTPQPKDEDVEMEDGDAEKSEPPAEKEQD